MSSAKDYLILKVIVREELLDHLYGFLISPGKTGTSETNGYHGFVRIHFQCDIIVSKITILSGSTGKLTEKVVKFAIRNLC